MEKQTKISLQFNRKDFEDIYFKNDQGDLLRDPNIKKPIRNLIISLVLTIIIFVYAMKSGDYSLFIISIIILGVFLFNYLDTALRFFKWKREVKAYLDKTEKTSTNRIVITNNYFSIIQDEKETIEKWSNFNRAEILSDYVSLIGKENYLIPAKSVSSEDYSILQKIISEKIKNN